MTLYMHAEYQHRCLFLVLKPVVTIFPTIPEFLETLGFSGTVILGKENNFGNFGKVKNLKTYFFYSTKTNNPTPFSRLPPVLRLVYSLP